MKNLLTFVCAAVLLPLSYFVSKLINVDFQNKDNPLTELGILFSVNQVLYLLIAMWIYPIIPEKMLMILAIILAHIYCHIVGFLNQGFIWSCRF